MGFDLKPDPTSSEPLYSQIKKYIVGQVQRGNWHVGYRLPSQREIAEMVGVDRSTVRFALESLTAEGVLDTRGRGGTTVKNNTWSLLIPPTPDWQSYLEAGVMTPNRDIVHRLHEYEFASELIRLGTGELSPSLFPKPRFDAAMDSLRATEYSLGYDHPNGLLTLRRALSDYYSDLGMKVAPSEILIVSGAIQAIHLISMGLLPRGASFITDRPSYLFSLNSLKTTHLPLVSGQPPGTSTWTESLRRLYSRARGSVYYSIPHFQNPTGMSLSKDDQVRLLETCQRLRLPIIEDDSYRELYYEGTRPLPLKYRDRQHSIIHIGTPSKSLCAGLRIGWMIGQEEVIAKLADLKMQIDYGTSTLSQLIFQNLLETENYQNNLKYIRGVLRERRDAMVSELNRGFADLAEWDVPSGGYFIWLRLRQPMNIDAIFDACIRQGVLINPGYMYDTGETNTIRLSFSYVNESQMLSGMHTLRQAITSQLDLPYGAEMKGQFRRSQGQRR